MKNLFLVAVLAIAFFSCQQKNFKIEGTVEGVTEGQAILKKIIKGVPTSLDTAQIVEGQFAFTGTENEGQLYLIFIDDIRMPVVFFGENKNIKIAVNTENINEAEITGSPISDIYTSFSKEVPGKDAMKEIQAEYQQAMTAGDQAAMATIKEEVTVLMEKQKAYFLQFVKNNTDNIVGAYLAFQAANEFEFDEFKGLVSKFEANLGEHMYVKELKKVLEPLEKAAAAEKATAVGAVAPDFTLETVNGDALALSSLKGKYILIDFWASWCKPCRIENPNVVKAYNEFSSKGFDILSVSLDRDSAAWKQAIKDDGLIWNQVIDGKGDIASTYGVSGIPFTLLLDKEGKIVAKNLRGEELTNKLAELLN